MAKALIKYKTLKEPGAIFAQAISTEYTNLASNKIVDYIIQTGTGTKANVTITIKAKLGEDGTEVTIPFKEKIGQTTYNNVEKTGKVLSIGGNAGECGSIVVQVDAQSLKGLYDRVSLSITQAASSTVVGTIIEALQEPRYSE